MAAGRPIEAASQAQRELEIPPTLIPTRFHRDAYALEVRGDSMIGAHICDGDLVVLEQREPRPRDIVAALSAAETGHLVFATLHTMSATETISRIIDFFPPFQQQQVRMSLAGSLRGIVSQRLVQRADGRGRVPAMEVLVATGRVFDKIADPSATHELEELIAEGEYYGMQTFDQSLLSLYEQGAVSRRDALSTSTNSHDLRLKMDASDLAKADRKSVV